MTPEELKEFEEIKAFIQLLKNSATIPHDVDSAFRARLINESTLVDLGLPSSLINAPRSAILAPTGGATVDSQARTAINDVITALEELGLVTEN